MPLVKGSSQKAISTNIEKMYAENKSGKRNRSRAQIMAIAYSVAGKSRKKKSKSKTR